MANGAMHEDLMVLGRNLAQQNAAQQPSMLLPSQHFIAPDPFTGVSPDGYSRRYASELDALKRHGGSVFAQRAMYDSDRQLQGELITDVTSSLAFLGGTIATSWGGGIWGGVAAAGATGILTEQILQNTGFYDTDPLVTLDNQSRAMVEGSMHKFAYSLGGHGYERGISMDDAHNLGSRAFDQLRAGGFHGVEASRALDTLGQYGSQLHMRSGSTEELGDEIEKYLDGVMDLVKRTGESVERATTMVVQATQMGVGPDGAANMLGNVADYSRTAGIGANQMLQAGMQHAGMFASAGFSSGEIVSNFAFGIAQVANQSANSYNAPMWAAMGGADQYAMHRSQLGAAFVTNPGMWGKMMGSGSFDQGAWDAMRFGREAPESYGDAYGELNRNDQLVAQYQGMQEMAMRPGEWTQAATGSLFQQMAKDDITDYRAQAMWLHQGGYAANIATARQDVVGHIYNQSASAGMNTAFHVGANNQVDAITARQDAFGEALDTISIATAIDATHSDRLHVLTPGTSYDTFSEALMLPGADGGYRALTRDRLLQTAHSSAGSVSFSGDVMGHELTLDSDHFELAEGGATRMGYMYLTNQIGASIQQGQSEEEAVYRMMRDSGRFRIGSNNSEDSYLDENTQLQNLYRDYTEATGHILTFHEFISQGIDTGLINYVDIQMADDGKSTKRETATQTIRRNIGDMSQLQVEHDMTAGINYWNEMFEGMVLATNANEIAGSARAASFLSDANAPDSALMMYARESGWANRTDWSERMLANDFGRRYEAINQDYAISSNQLTRSQLNTRLNAWQTTGGVDSGWNDFLANVSETKAAFHFSGGDDISDAYDAFAQTLYGRNASQLSGQERGYIDTYIGVSGASDDVRAAGNGLIDELINLSGTNVSNARYTDAMERVTGITGLKEEKVQDISMFGIYKAQSGQLSLQIENAVGPERTRLLAKKAEYDNAMNLMIAEDEGLQLDYDNYYNSISHIAGDQDTVVAFAGRGTLDERLARTDSAWRRATGNASFWKDGAVSLDEMQNMTDAEFAARVDTDKMGDMGSQIESIMEKVRNGGQMTDADVEWINRVAGANPDSGESEETVTLDGQDESTGRWVQIASSSIQALGTMMFTIAKGNDGLITNYLDSLVAETPEEVTQ